jgi:hypothetical protein
MQNRKHLVSLAVAPLLACAIAAPASIAAPLPASQADMYASTVHKPAATNQHLQSEAAASASQSPATGQDQRTEGAKDTSRAPSRPDGMPSWPANPQPITPAVQQPVADDGGDGIDWQVPVLAIAGTLLLGAGLGAATIRYRTTNSHAAG